MFTDLSISTHTCESFIYFYYFFKLYSTSQTVWPERKKRKEKALRPMLTLGRSREGKSFTLGHTVSAMAELDGGLGLLALGSLSRCL